MLDKARPVWNRESGEVEPLPFQKLNVVDAYNYGMNHVDRADQLRGQYRPDHWMRQRKWWWSIFVWLQGISMTNAYIVYKRVMEGAGAKPLSHREFVESVVTDLSTRIVTNRATRKSGVIPFGCIGSKRKRSSDVS
eukprot:6257018-Pyramimonas_sp.AAC.1